MTKFKRFFLLLSISILAASNFPVAISPVYASQTPEDNSGAVLCAPDVYMLSPGDCAPLGPSETLTQLAKLGIRLPIEPLQFTRVDPALNDLQLTFFKVDPNTGTQFYSSMEGAQEKQGASQIIPPGKLLYVVYDNRYDTKNGTVYQLPSGQWMPGDGSAVGLPNIKPGIEFTSTPKNGFGWALEPNVPVRSQPNFLRSNAPIRTLTCTGEGCYPIVQVFAIQNIEGTNWDLIGPDEWVPGDKLAAVFPNTTPPSGVTTGRWIDVNLDQQTLAVYDNNQMVFATVMASGVKNFWTRPGLFQIYEKKDLETMSGDRGTPDFYYLENVPWTMYFDKERALHGAYWRARLGYSQSHGCVNLAIGDAHWLYNWAKIGDWVYVHDPSGATPTDPALYGSGGA